MKRVFRLLIWIVVLGGIGYGVASQMNHASIGAKKEVAKREVKPISVTIEPVMVKEIQRSVRGVGTLYGREEIPISTKVEGRVVRIHKEVGDIVKPGDLLLEIDPIDYQLAVSEARRLVELELSKLGLREMPTGRFDVSKVPTVIRELAQESLALARKDRAVRANSSMSIDEKQQAQAEYDVAKSNVQQAMLEAETTLVSARQKQAQLDTLMQRLADTKIYAPAPGSKEIGDTTSQPPADVEYVLSQRSVSEGEMLRILPGTSSAIFKLVIDKTLKLMVQIPERFRRDLEVGQEAEIEIEGFNREPFRGVLWRISPTVEKTSRTYQLEIRVPNDNRRLSPGSYARASIITERNSKAILVPEEAIVRFAGVTKIFLLENDQAREILVEPGVSMELPHGDPKQNRTRIWREVKAEIPADAKVIVTGQSQLSNGSPVRVR